MTKRNEPVRARGFHRLSATAFVEFSTLTCDDFLEKIRSTPSTSLRLIKDAAFERRYRALEASVAGQD